MRLLQLILCVALLALPLAAGPKAVKKSEPPREPVIAMKEKALPPTGTQYLYIDPKTPRYLIDLGIKKGMQIAFLFEQSQAGWLREIIPTFGGMNPIIFLRGGLGQMEALRLKETLEFFDYNVTIIHLKFKPGDTLGALPVANITVIERKLDKERTQFIMTRGKQAAETGKLLTVLDERDLDDPFGVAGGIHFAQYGIRLVNLDEGGDAKLPAADRTIIFGRSEKNIQKFIEK
ncbi:MAG TPA: hypothetical protein PLV42_08815 [bacterium]|nr:hypothetical protein [bacterium]